MKKRLLVTLLVTLLAVTTATLPSAAGSDPPKLDPLAFGLAVLDATQAPVFDPLDPPGFFRVQATEYDPAGTQLVQGTWLNAIGCPTDADVAVYPATTPTTTYTDPACAVGDPKDEHNEGLLLVKTGPTPNNASAVAELHNVKGITLTELGYDIRKLGNSTSPLGSHCGAGAPRFNILTTTGFFGIGCNSPPADTQVVGSGWLRLRWGGSVPLMGFQNFVTLVPVTGEVKRIQIVFDEGQDASGGPDQFGAAILDNIDVNNSLVGHGNVDAD
jgi:hypothetical protein